ncbi:hypothetical protein [Gordonia malaquae]|nr:hypothetical protein [Gordonia malaquae]
MKTPTAPTKLGPKGRKLWNSIAGKYVLRADEMRTLEDACREADLIEKMEKEHLTAALIVKGSQGQPVINPLVSELRQHRATLGALLKSLKLPDEVEAAAAEGRSTAARNAANARWGKRTG